LRVRDCALNDCQLPNAITMTARFRSFLFTTKAFPGIKFGSTDCDARIPGYGWLWLSRSRSLLKSIF
jgi:hypothetical protein